MKKVLNFSIFISIVFFFVGCGSPYRQAQLNEIIEGKDLLIKIPSINWNIHKEYNQQTWKRNASGTPFIYHNNGNEQFSIYTNKYYKGGQDKYFIKNSHYSDTDIDGQRIFDKNDKETGITYGKSWISYINYLKCNGGVFSRGFGGSYQSIGVKFYHINCGYYDTSYKENDGKRILHVDYRYTHNPNTKDGKHREKDIKNAVKKAIATLKIKNIDIKRMEKENLMHYDKEFKSTKW